MDREIRDANLQAAIDEAALGPLSCLEFAKLLVSHALAQGLPYPASVDGEAHALRAKTELRLAIKEFEGQA